MEENFDKICARIAILIGSPVSFFVGIGLVLIWLIAGPFFNWSDFHAFLLNDVTTCATFLLVFILQNSQNKATKELEKENKELKNLIKQVLNKLNQDTESQKNCNHEYKFIENNFSEECIHCGKIVCEY